jgi:Fe-S cluster assembly protein SufD
MSAGLAEKIAQEHAAVAGALPSSVVDADQRRRAVETLSASGLPTSRDENWKYANLRPLEKVRLAPSSSAAAVKATDLPPEIEGYARYTFVDGSFVAGLSKPAGVSGMSVGRSSSGAETSMKVDERFALLNDAFATDGAVVDVARNVDCPACIEVVFVATEPATAAASYPRLELNVAADARLGLIERHISLNSDANFVNVSVRVNIACGAQVNHYRVQESGAKATWFDTLNAKLDQDARYEVHAVNLGALSARSTIHVQLAGERAELALHVVSLGDQQQTHDAYALVEHIAPNTKSEQNVRAIGGGRARVAFNSKVVVREHAKGTDSRQSLRSLLAGPQAEIDVRPQLEIYTDDVKCNHGATAGKLDDNMLFYLLSRGIERDTAQRLLKWAFLEDVVSRIAIPDLRKHIETRLAGQMQETAALKDLI